MEITMYIIWACVLVIGVVVEMASVQQIGWAASIGGFGALVAHAVTKGDPIWIELATFGIVWIISWVTLFILLKPYLKKMHDKEDGFYKFINADALVVKPNTTHGFGKVKVDGKIFRFQSQDVTKKNEVVTIKEIKGVTMIVAKKETKWL